MYLQFKETFNKPVKELFPFFRTPADWAKLYGVVKPTKKLKDGWYAVPIKAFPFPLKARNVEMIENQRVRWVFGGFWSGVGDLTFYEQDGKTVIEGFEYIKPYGLYFLAGLFEKLFMIKEFKRIWAIGWHRLRKEQK
jgi:hypothetical protein